MSRRRPAKGCRALLGATAAVLLLAGCSSAGPRPAGGVDRPASSGASAAARLAPRCPPPPDRRPSVSAAQLNRAVAAADLPAWQAADVGASARLSDGRLVWLFGDTVRTARFAPRVVANSMLVSSGWCVSQLRTPGDGPVIPDASTDTVYWPMSVATGRVHGPEMLVVLASRIRRGQGTFDFTFLGTSAAIFTVAPGGVPRLVRVRRITADSTDPNQVNWGAAIVASGGWYYVYGTRLTGRAYEFGRELRVARMPASAPWARRRWQFWDGRRWQPEVTRAAPVLGARGGVSQTLSVDVVDGKFVAVSKRDGDIGDFAYKWVAPHAWGPWTPERAFSAPAGYDTGTLEYMPLAHPEIRLSSGKLLVSVSRNTTSPARLFADPEIGRPHFVEVPRD